MIIIKNKQQQDGVRKSADLLSAVFARIKTIISPGITTAEIDRVVEETIRAGGGIPAFLGYSGFPASTCVSVNDQVIHGIPGERVLYDGDIVGCDIGVILDGYFSDACRTYPVGDTGRDALQLLTITEKSLYDAIAACGPGARIKDIGKAVTETVSPYNYGIVYSYCGHGVGLALHEAPQIQNYYPSKGLNPRMKSGMIFAIEPMINAGTPDVEVLEDEWTVVTADGSLSAHFEHTVLITDNGAEILTDWED